MAEVSKQYNLRSSKTDPIHVPVQLQLSDDSQFISQLMKQQENSVQVSDSNSSASDLNCSDLVQSDDETSNGKSKNDSSSDSVVSDKQNPSTSVSQDMINAQLLAQLQSIGQRLTKIKSTQCKKSTDSAKIKSTSKKPNIRLRSHCHRHKKKVGSSVLPDVTECFYCLQSNFSFGFLKCTTLVFESMQQSVSVFPKSSGSEHYPDTSKST